MVKRILIGVLLSLFVAAPFVLCADSAPVAKQAEPLTVAPEVRVIVRIKYCGDVLGVFLLRETGFTVITIKALEPVFAQQLLAFLVQVQKARGNVMDVELDGQCART